ncbi:MAG: hypothetical protein BWY64_03148 [bacterium ADurb.Bin363]|nr:MAG: hypothetical protein BWY64_03148 [bacterium ADurb.Bin363]
MSITGKDKNKPRKVGLRKNGSDPRMIDACPCKDCCKFCCKIIGIVKPIIDKIAIVVIKSLTILVIFLFTINNIETPNATIINIIFISLGFPCLRKKGPPSFSTP